MFLVGNESLRDGDLELFFGPVADDDMVLKLAPSATMVDVVVEAGIFNSRGEAKRNGWLKPIPAGFSEHVIGKLKRRIAILNAKEQDE